MGRSATPNLYERRCLVDPAVSHVLPVDEEEPVELLQSAVDGDGAAVLDVHDVDARLAAVPAQPKAELLARLPVESKIHVNVNEVTEQHRNIDTGIPFSLQTTFC